MARVLTWAEVEKLPLNRVYWFEFKKRGDLYSQYLLRGHIGNHRRGLFLYGLEWRIWTEKPMAKQRRDTPWTQEITT